MEEERERLIDNLDALFGAETPEQGDPRDIVAEWLERGPYFQALKRLASRRSH